MILKLTLFLGMLLLLPEQSYQSPPSSLPLCTSQYALVNYACSRLPFRPVPPSPPVPPPSPPAPDDDHGHHGHRQSHRHRHRRQHHAGPQEEECCKWLKEMDSECVCTLLVHLPPFLAKPFHDYTVIVGDACTVTFSCPQRLVA